MEVGGQRSSDGWAEPGASIVPGHAPALPHGWPQNATTRFKALCSRGQGECGVFYWVLSDVVQSWHPQPNPQSMEASCFMPQGSWE